MTLPSGYTGPLSPTRDPNQVMRDTTAQNLIAQICQLHEAYMLWLDNDIARAAQGPTEPASGYVTGSRGQGMDASVAAVRQAEAERTRCRKSALEELRRVIGYYEQRLGMRPPRRPRVESIDYRNNGERQVG